MADYKNIYEKRLNRYGLNYQERVLTQRREVFNRMLLKSVYRIDFDWQGDIYPAIFERYKQDNTEIMRYLFTAYDLMIPNGTVLMLPDPIGTLEHVRDKDLDFNETMGVKPHRDKMENPDLRPWMIFYLEDNGAKGYNRYIMLKMTHFLRWKDRDKIDRESYAYMYGQEDNMLKDELRSRSRMDPLYDENLKSSFFVMPSNPYVRKDDYFIIDKDINNKVLEEYYRVTGYDIQSQDGVEYVTVDPIYEYSSDFYDDTIKNEKAPIIEEIKERHEQKLIEINQDDSIGDKDKAIEAENKRYHDEEHETDSTYFWLDGMLKNPGGEG